MVFEPDFEDFGNDPGVANYRRFLSRGVNASARNATQLSRATSYNALGSAQQQGLDTANRVTTGAFGMNNPSGLQAQLGLQSSLGANYGRANLEAKEAGRQTRIQMGEAYQRSLLGQADYYNALIGPFLQEQIAGASLAAQGEQGKYALIAGILGAIGGGTGSYYGAQV